MLGQIIKIIRLLGLARAGRMKRHHELGLKYIRGYAATACWWTLLNSGFFEELKANHDHIYLPKYLEKHPELDRGVLGAILEYLDGIGLLRRKGEAYFLTADGRALLEEPRGLFELGWAYEPCFRELPEMLLGRKKYGKDLSRRITFVGLGSGRLCEQLPYPIMRQMVLARGCKMVLDLGCGDMAFLAGLCRMNAQIRCLGIDFDAEMIAYDQQRLQAENFGGRLTSLRADMFTLPELPPDLPPVDAITACDTFHEYLGAPGRIVNLLKGLRQRFPQAVFVIGEFCRQDPAWLRRHPTASLEHHLFHELSNQQIGAAADWRKLFAEAGLRIEEEQVFDMIGHGYFALK